jgi:hypothetical protein
LLGLFLTVDELKKSSVVCPCSRTLRIARSGAIRTKNKFIKLLLIMQQQQGIVIAWKTFKRREIRAMSLQKATDGALSAIHEHL